MRSYAAAALGVLAACNVSYGAADPNAADGCPTCENQAASSGAVGGGATGDTARVIEGSGNGTVTDSTDGGTLGGTDASASTPDAAMEAGPPPVLSPVISNFRLNAVVQASVQVAWSAPVSIAFDLTNLPAQCRLDATAFAGTSTSLNAPATNGTYPHTVTCTNAGGSASARFNVVAQDVGRWFQANAQNCATYCPTQGGRANAQSVYGARCASGERQVPWPADQGTYGDFAYTYGVWPNRTPSGTTFTINTSSNGPHCYSPGQGQDGDATDLTVACFCKKL